MWVLPTVLKERPAIHSGIKSLYLSLSCEGMDGREADANNNFKSGMSTGNFQKWCICITAALELEL